MDRISHFLSKIYKVLSNFWVLSSMNLMKIWCKYIKLPLPIYYFLAFSTNKLPSYWHFELFFTYFRWKKRPHNFWTKFEKIWHSDKRERELILPLGISKKTEYRIFLNKTPLGKKINFFVKKIDHGSKGFCVSVSTASRGAALFWICINSFGFDDVGTLEIKENIKLGIICMYQ